MKKSTKKDGASFTIESLKRDRKTITAQTEIYFKGCKELKQHNETEGVFKMKYRQFENAGTYETSVWFFMLFIGLPMLLLVDYASLKEFFLFLQSRVDGFFGSIIGAIGFLLFGLIEIGVGAFILLVRQRDREGKASRGQVWIGRLLMVVMIILPLLLIYTGYLLDEDKNAAKLIKTLVLMLLSFAIHVFIFATIENVWAAITYFFGYKPKAFMLRFSNPEHKLEKIKPLLMDSYHEYDDNMSEFNKLSAEDKVSFNPELGKRERLLKEKLTNGFEDDDYDVQDIMEKPVEPTPDNGGTSASATATPKSEGEGRIGFKYIVNSTL